MRFSLSVAALVVGVFLCTAAFADTVVITTAGSGWQSGYTIDENAKPYWDNKSSDGAKKNVGYCITGTGNCGMSGAPGYLPYLGLSTGAADPSFYLDKTTSGSQAALQIEIAGLAGRNQFGWYNTDLATPVLNVIFTGPDDAGDVATFTPSAHYGFWFSGQSIYFTQSSRNTNAADKGIQHFAIFQGTPNGTYWVGMEDLNWAGSDKDYNDMVIKISPVPDGGSTVLLLGCALVGAEALRRRLRQ
jgi:hypothetical protein